MTVKLKKVKLRNFKSYGLQRRLNVNLKTLLNSNTVNPMVRAQSVWAIVSEQLNDVLGEEIHRQWFLDMKPRVVIEKHLILETSSNKSARWIKRNYLDLINALISSHECGLKVFLVAPEDKDIQILVKSTTSEINSYRENEKR